MEYPIAVNQPPAASLQVAVSQPAAVSRQAAVHRGSCVARTPLVLLMGLLAGLGLAMGVGVAPASAESGAIMSRVEATIEGELMLVQTVDVKVPLADAWSAYTTSEGWRGWVAPLAEFDLRTDGLIRTNYDASGSLDGPGTITLHVINFIPQQLLTIQAEILENFPGFLKEDEERLYNVITFEATSDNSTRIVAHGLGYRDNEKYRGLLDFFVKANEWTFEKLVAYLEEGEVSDFNFER